MIVFEPVTNQNIYGKISKDLNTAFKREFL